MSLVSANGVPVIGGTITMPLIGVWSADLVVDQPDGSGFDVGTKVSVAAVDGVELDGVVIPDRTGSYLDAVHVRIMGGAGGLSGDAKPRGYAQPGATVRDVVNGLLADAGETLSDTVDSGLLSINLTAWGVIAAPVSQALKVMIQTISPTANWRILSDGTFWFGVETWPDSSAVYDLMSHNPSDGTYDLGVTSPSIVPGVTVDGIGKINRVEHQLSSETIRTRAWIDMTQIDRGVLGSVMQIVRQATYAIDYFTLYDAKVVSQSDDGGTVDVQPLDARLPGLSKVPLRLGLPGCVVKFSSGAVVRLGWDRGNPSMPYCSMWNGGAVTQLIQFNGGTLPIARKTDPVYLGKLSGVAGPFPVTFAFIPAAASGGEVTPADAHVAAGVSVDLGGFITSGVAELKA